MKKILFVLVTIGLLTSCNSKKNEKPIEYDSIDTTRTAVIETSKLLSKPVIYKGLLPCADCRGIETTLKIYKDDDFQFEMISVYKGKDPETEFTQKGVYTIDRGFGRDADATLYVLNSNKDHSIHIYYGSMSDNPDKLYLLDGNREIIESELDYFLTLEK